jgi:hypothetical protein
MVRLLAAGLVEVGQGRLTPQQLQQVLAGGDRSKLPEAAPACGLYLKQVRHGVQGCAQAVVHYSRHRLAAAEWSIQAAGAFAAEWRLLQNLVKISAVQFGVQAVGWAGS